MKIGEAWGGLTLLIIVAALCAVILLTGCSATTEKCPPKSDTQVITETISDILVPKVRWGC